MTSLRLRPDSVGVSRIDDQADIRFRLALCYFNLFSKCALRFLGPRPSG